MDEIVNDAVQPLKTWVRCEDVFCRGVPFKTRFTRSSGKRDYRAGRAAALKHHEATGHTVRVEQSRTEVFLK